ncbi:cysteine hydrolase family protein [Blastochloris viridis]|uniref:Amidases related to nicotinamidase n=1 Tax=Blastochloris viridis TaxID=1079 RepID=A0A0H5BPG9_BLAVI|nr:isochorismatase family cysteine hydrolase [Blastochloris viridis]ALK10765.1 Isochorismatase family protein YecD [Blastochloris viridis]BAR99268.1 amidases related to nicotinamidase [Blastochloris viridis]CUU43427.1 Isochorismatase family protein yecD [Blastochloris viridis]
MSWKTRNRSFYYLDAPEPLEPTLDPAATALLVIDVQNTYVERPPREALTSEAGRQQWDAWTPFHTQMSDVVIPNIASALSLFRANRIECVHARIACRTQDGRDRSLSQKKPGFNNLLLPKNERSAQIVPALAPVGDEITVIKTTDSALTGTNLRLTLHNLGIRTVVCAGIFTDQCVASTVRSLADESFEVIVLEDCCAAATAELHAQELAIINMIYCDVMTLAEFADILARRLAAASPTPASAAPLP